jgi:hypothetical protein
MASWGETISKRGRLLIRSSCLLPDKAIPAQFLSDNFRGAMLVLQIRQSGNGPSFVCDGQNARPVLICQRKNPRIAKKEKSHFAVSEGAREVGKQKETLHQTKKKKEEEEGVKLAGSPSRLIERSWAKVWLIDS